MTLHETILLPEGTHIERTFGAFGVEGLDWFTVTSPAFIIEGWVGMPEDDVQRFVEEHADPEDVEQVLLALREGGFTS